jgi:predicted dehydrogenase
MSQKEEEDQRKYNCLIIGAGGQGALADAPGSGNEHKIISFAHALKEHKGFKLNGFYDKDSKKSIKAIETWSGSAYFNIERAIEVDKTDVVVIATSDSDHYKILKQLAEYPLKLVICEKPICETLQQAREIVELYKSKGIPLMVNYTRRFLPYYEDLKRRYDAGEFGKLISWNLDFNRGLLHTGSHMVDFIQWFFGYQLNGMIKIERDNEITKERIEANYRIWQIQLFFEKYHWREERIGDSPIWDYYDKSHWHVVDNAYNFLEGKEPLKCTGEDGLKALEICYELMEDIK